MKYISDKKKRDAYIAKIDKRIGLCGETMCALEAQLTPPKDRTFMQKFMCLFG